MATRISQAEARKYSRGVALLLCDNVALDSGGSATVHGTFDSIYFREFPAKQEHIAVLAAIERGEADEREFKVLFYGPDKKIFHKGGSIVVDQWGESGRAEAVLNCYDFSFPVPGMYRVVLASGNRSLLETPLLLKQDRFQQTEIPIQEQHAADRP